MAIEWKGVDMILFLAAIAAGLVLLVWSAGKFVDGAATAARYAGMSPLLIGMVIIGFGTSMPEMVVSALGFCPGQSRGGTGQRLWIQHRQYRPDPRAYCHAESHYRGIHSGPQGTAHPYGQLPL
jgi:hypothetical protein